MHKQRFLAWEREMVKGNMSNCVAKRLKIIWKLFLF